MPKPIPEPVRPEDIWIDLCDPGEDERRKVEERFGITVPDLASLTEIEASSRLRTKNEALILTAPLLSRGAAADRLEYVPTGFILLPNVLITVHYAPLGAFEAVQGSLTENPPRTPLSMFARLLEEVVDRAADHLEMLSEVTSSISKTVFYTDIDKRGLKAETAILRRTIIKLGRASERASQLRHTSLSIGRAVKFVIDRDEHDAEANSRLRRIVQDIDSLDEFETSISERIQFLLDAATSLINIGQNAVVTVLTVASVAGIPPVLVAGVYGMNFKFMPELSWPWGYPFALALCVVSTLIPYLWFKWRKWV
jgi:Mg2+ and Co2+ transporters